jgi:hypothetical protein
MDQLVPRYAAAKQLTRLEDTIERLEQYEVGRCTLNQVYP